MATAWNRTGEIAGNLCMRVHVAVTARTVAIRLALIGNGCRPFPARGVDRTGTAAVSSASIWRFGSPANKPGRSASRRVSALLPW